MGRRIILHHGRPATSVEITNATIDQIRQAMTDGAILSIKDASPQQIKRALRGHPEDRMGEETTRGNRNKY